MLLLSVTIKAFGRFLPEVEMTMWSVFSFEHAIIIRADGRQSFK